MGGTINAWPLIRICLYGSTTNSNVSAGALRSPANSGTRIRSSSYRSTANGNVTAVAPVRSPANSGTRIRSSSYGATSNGNVTTGFPLIPANSGTKLPVAINSPVVFGELSGELSIVSLAALSVCKAALFSLLRLLIPSKYM